MTTKRKSRPIADTPPDDLAPPDDERTRRVSAIIESRALEVAAVAASGWRAVDTTSVVSKEIVAFLAVKRTASLSVLVREIEVPAETAAQYVIALAKAGLVRQKPRERREGTPFIESLAPPVE